MNMKKTLLILLCPLMISACSSDDDNSVNQNQGTEQPNEDPEDTVSKTVFLAADGVTDTYTLLNQHGYYEEVPDLGYNSDKPDCGHDVKHITQSWDSELGKYVFEMHLHVENGIVDTDRCKDGMEDRQRNEIKTYSGSPETMYGTRGETHTYGWKFRLDENFLGTSNFTHIHQIKAAGGDDDSMPLITFTPRVSGQLQIIHVAPVVWDYTYIGKLDLSDFLGEWVEVTEVITYEYDADYSLSIVRVSDQKELINYTGKLDMWREGADLIRPKYGMYRKVYTDTTQSEMLDLKDETIKFADFLLVEHEE